MPDIDERAQRTMLEDHGWIPVGKPLGEGGGARVFKVVSADATTRFVAPLLCPSDIDKARPLAQDMAQTIAEIADGTQRVIAAGKVAKEEEHRTKREIEILRDVQHPNLIRMIDYDKTAAPRWYVMPVMRGGTLKDTGAKFTGNLSGVLHGMIQIADALGALHGHEKTIVHRDVKPGNIFIGDAGEWILGDPGIAYRDDGADETITRPVSKDWFPRWYDDELGHGPVTDIYMLGAVGFYLLTGQMMKPLDPTFLRKPRFDLPALFPTMPGIREVYELLLSVVSSHPETITLREGNGFAAALRALLPIVTSDAAHALSIEVQRLRAEPRQLVSYSSEHMVSGPVQALKRMPVWIPIGCDHLVVWITSDQSFSVDLWDSELPESQLQQSSGPLVADKINRMPVPIELRGRWGFLRVAGLGGAKTGTIRALTIFAAG